MRSGSHVFTVVVACAAALTAACAGGRAPGSAPRTVIMADGSSTVFPITEAVAEEFQKTNAATRVTVGSSGTGGGFQKFCRDEIDVSNASRPIRQTEADACGRAGIDYIELPVAYDGIAIVVHPKNTWARSMTVDELKRLWEPAAQGKITRWKQIRADWPDEPIRLFGAGVDSGTFEYFTEAIVGKAAASRGDYTSSEDDNVIVQGVSGDQFALGYFGYAYYEQNQDSLTLVAIDDTDDSNGAGPIAPSPESVSNGTYRPLSRPVFIYVKARSLERPEVADFVRFYLDEGQELVREVGYVPMTRREVDLTRGRFDARKTGTMFEGIDSHSAVTLEQRLSK